MKYNSPFLSFLQKVLDILLLGILWIVCSLPLISIAASSAALYHSTVKVVKKEYGSLFSDFFTTFRDNFKSGILLSVLHLLSTALIVLYFCICLAAASVSSSKLIFLILGVLIVLLYLAINGFLFPLFSRFQFRTLNYYTATIYLILHHIKQVLLLILIPIVLAPLIYLNPLFFLLLPGLTAYAKSAVLEPVFRQYMSEDDCASFPWFSE